LLLVGGPTLLLFCVSKVLILILILFVHCCTQAIADGVLLLSIGYAERRVQAANQKMKDHKAELLVQDHELEKGAKKGQKIAATRQSKRNKNLQAASKKSNGFTKQPRGGNGHAKQSNFHIQQPSKRD
jgi:hypothetical protein